MVAIMHACTLCSGQQQNGVQAGVMHHSKPTTDCSCCAWICTACHHVITHTYTHTHTHTHTHAHTHTLLVCLEHSGLPPYTAIQGLQAQFNSCLPSTDSTNKLSIAQQMPNTWRTPHSVPAVVYCATSHVSMMFYSRAAF